MNVIIKRCNELDCPTGKKHANPASCGLSTFFALEILCTHGQNTKLVDKKLHDAEAIHASKKVRN